MNYLQIPIKVKIIILLFVACTSFSFSQIKFGVGGYFGGGTIKGASTSIGSFSASLFVETNTVLFLDVTPRLGVIYARDFDAILPNTKKPYLPFVQGISLKGITVQNLADKIFLEEGVGFLTLNDRTFSDTNSWSFGIVLSIAGGWDLRDISLNGFKIGAGLEFGLTFTRTLAQYSSFYFYFNYSI